MPTNLPIVTAARRQTGSRSSSAFQNYKEDVMRCSAFVFALALATGAQAEQFPTKTVRLVAGVTPGSAADTMARVLSEKMAASLGQSVIVENRLGAGGAVAAKYVAT